VSEHRIDLQPDLRPHQHGPTPMLYCGKAIGSSNSPIFAAARWLLDNGAAWPDDTVVTYRRSGHGETLCMAGKAGELAKWTVSESDHGSPSLQLVRWRPFPTAAGAPKTPETGLPATPVPATLV
jgi:hypothetical protein